MKFKLRQTIKIALAAKGYWMGILVLNANVKAMSSEFKASVDTCTNEFCDNSIAFTELTCIQIFTKIESNTYLNLQWSTNGTSVAGGLPRVSFKKRF